MNTYVAVLGPSGSGKSSLISSLFIHTQEILRQARTGIGLFPDENDKDESDETSKDKFDAAATRFAKSIADNKDMTFQALLEGNAARIDYKLKFAFPTTYSGPNLNVYFTDYPGGWLNTEKMLEISEYIDIAHVLLVPIPADILLYLGENDPKKFPNGNREASKRWETCYDILKIHEVTNEILAWMNHRAETQNNSLLYFVPIRCEHCFKDNGHDTPDARELVEKLSNLIIENYVKTLYISEDAKKYIQIKIHAVDTYGISKFESIDPQTCLSTFRISIPRTRPRRIAPKGAFELMSDIIDFSLTRLTNQIMEHREETQTKIKNRPWWKKVKIAILGGDQESEQVEIDTHAIDALHESLKTISEKGKKYSQKPDYSQYREKDLNWDEIISAEEN